MSRFALSTEDARVFGLDGLEWSVILTSSAILGLAVWLV